MTRFESAFGALGIAPTQDVAEVKRAYFAAVRRHPPHADPAAFRRIRDAYERLSTAAGRAAEALAEPIDTAAELAPLRRRFDGALASAAADARGAREVCESVRRFVEAMSGASWSEAVTRFG